MLRINILLLIILFCSCGNNTVLKQHVVIDSYPSASGIENIDDKLYVIGDDANYLLILNKELEVVDSISLYNYKEKRISKTVKADLEAIIATRNKQLLLVGSGSLSPSRDVAWLIDPKSKRKDSINLKTFYQNLILAGIKEINIEGACAIPGAIILSNRGNKGNPKNQLIVTNPDFWNNQNTAPISLITTTPSAVTSIFNGVSGLCYAPQSDRLIISVSTEDTRNTLDDGTIGKSYLWLVKNISSKKNWKAINPDQVIDLEKIDPIFKGQKIESVCVTKETRNFLYIVLAADNDNGSSSFFKLIVDKN